MNQYYDKKQGGQYNDEPRREPVKQKPQFTANAGLPYKDGEETKYANHNVGAVFVNNKGGLTLNLNAVVMAGIVQGVLARGGKPTVNIFLNNVEENENQRG